MKLLVGAVASFVVGLGCRYFDIPVPSPPSIPGALLVLAMTVGYSSTNAFLNRKGNLATTSHLCGGPTGSPAVTAKSQRGTSSLIGPFYGFNRPGVKSSEAAIQNWWRQGMMGGASRGTRLHSVPYRKSSSGACVW
jgi:XapX domain-containing protein